MVAIEVRGKTKNVGGGIKPLCCGTSRFVAVRRNVEFEPVTFSICYDEPTLDADHPARGPRLQPLATSYNQLLTADERFRDQLL